MKKIYCKTLNKGEKKQITELLAKKNTIRLQQVHGNKILALKGNKSLVKYYQGELGREYDGVITDQENLYLTIKHADCCPVFLYSEDKTIIGMLHCGWRSVQKGIIEETREILKKKFQINQKIFFSLGPAICQKCYVVGEDLVKEFVIIIKQYQLNGKNYFISKENNLFFDLKKIIRDISVKNGFYFQKSSRICTLEHDDYFSHRENKTLGRNISFIVKK